MPIHTLAYLSRYPVDTLKIDRSFVTEMLVQPRTQAVVEAIVRPGQAMGLAGGGEGGGGGGEPHPTGKAPA